MEPKSSTDPSSYPSSHSLPPEYFFLNGRTSKSEVPTSAGQREADPLMLGVQSGSDR